MALQSRRFHGRRFAYVPALAAVMLIVSGFTYQLAAPGRKLLFPNDHYSHPNYKIEWWYYTGHLATESGRRYGYQVTFFRFGLRDRQSAGNEEPLFTDLYMAHFALSDIAARQFHFRERINRGYAGKAGAAPERYEVWNEGWKVEGNEKGHRISINDRGTKLNLRLVSLKPPVLHGQEV
jgi:predicted secreted hydrolase